MQRRFISILTILILLVAMSAGAKTTKRTSSKRSRTTRVSKKRKSTQAQPLIRENTDSILAARRAQQIQDSLVMLRQQVSDGDVAAMYELASWYYTGHNVDRDYDKAVGLWQQAVDGGSVRAIAELGKCYQNGHGVPRDSVEAARLFVQAIKSGHGTLFKQMLDSAKTSKFYATIVGICYERGEGVKRDVSKAADLFANASALGSEDATCRAGLCYLEVGDTIRAMDFLPRAAMSGNTDCQYWTGKVMLNEGSDIQRALGFLMMATDKGMPQAQDEVGVIYADGLYLPQDQNKAFSCFGDAARQEYAPAMWHYGLALRERPSANPDYDGALYWAAKALRDGFQADIDELMSEYPGFSDYVYGLKAFLIDSDFAAASEWFKKSYKARKALAPKVMQAVLLSDNANPKANLKKAVKTLVDYADDSAQAAFWLADIYTDEPQVVNEQKAAAMKKRAEDRGYIYDLGTICSLLSQMP